MWATCDIGLCALSSDGIETIAAESSDPRGFFDGRLLLDGVEIYGDDGIGGSSDGAAAVLSCEELERPRPAVRAPRARLELPLPCPVRTTPLPPTVRTVSPPTIMDDIMPRAERAAPEPSV